MKKAGRTTKTSLVAVPAAAFQRRRRFLPLGAGGGRRPSPPELHTWERGDGEANGEEDEEDAGKAPPKRRGKVLSSDNGDGRNSAKRGPCLPFALRKELDCPNPESAGSGDEVGDVSARGDVYEYDEAVAEEDSKKNRRFDSVDNLEYELSHDFEDENVSSDMDDDDGSDNELDDSDKSEAGDLEKDESHARMLQNITGMPTEAFQGKKRRRNATSGASAEVEDDHEASSGPITFHDLLDPLHGEPVYSKLRKRMHQLENRSLALHAPLPKSECERLER